MTILCTYFALIIISSCSYHRVFGLFVRPPSKIELYPDLKLSIADELNIPYRGVALNSGKYASYKGFQLSLNAGFGALTESDFNKLMKSYGGWSETKSRVKWNEGQSYTLIDFLPPLIQATSGLHFRSSRTTQKGLPYLVENDKDSNNRILSFFNKRNNNYYYKDQEVLLTSNCWGFAWEVLFQADNADTKSITISTADPTSAWTAFTGPGFDLIQSSRVQPELLKDFEKRNQKLKSGDVLLIWHQNPSTASGKDLFLDHVATCIDKDVYYEKSGSGDNVPFRLSTWDMITANFPTSVFFWEWRRLVRNNPLSPNIYGSVPRLQPASEIFGIDSQISEDENAQKLLAKELSSSEQDTSTQGDDDDAATKGSRRSIFNKLLNRNNNKNDDVAQKLSLQIDFDDDGTVASQVYTGILILEDLVFDKSTGRASLPKSAFLPQWYQMIQDMNFK